MAILFLLFFITIIVAYCNRYKVTFWLLGIGWVLAALLLWYNMTSTLQIRW